MTKKFLLYTGLGCVGLVHQRLVVLPARGAGLTKSVAFPSFGVKRQIEEAAFAVDPPDMVRITGGAFGMPCITH